MYGVSFIMGNKHFDNYLFGHRFKKNRKKSCPLGNNGLSVWNHNAFYLLD